MTLVEVLVAAAMSIVIVGGGSSLVISAVRQQPELSERSQNVTTARWQLDRMTREIRNGVSVTTAEPAKVSLLARVHHTTCGGSPAPAETAAIQCQITYTCPTASDYCTRVEAAAGVFTGASTKIVTGIDSSSVFCFVPSAETDPTECGPAKSGTTPTYVGITLNVPNPSGPSALTVSDGASLRTATFTG